METALIILTGVAGFLVLLSIAGSVADGARALNRIALLAEEWRALELLDRQARDALARDLGDRRHD
jgi:hypothetical protein